MICAYPPPSVITPAAWPAWLAGILIPCVSEVTVVLDTPSQPKGTSDSRIYRALVCVAFVAQCWLMSGSPCWIATVEIPQWLSASARRTGITDILGCSIYLFLVCSHLYYKLYIETSLERPLQWKATCVVGLIPGKKVAHISATLLNVSPKITCLRRQYFMANGAVFNDGFYRYSGYLQSIPNIGKLSTVICYF